MTLLLVILILNSVMHYEPTIHKTYAGREWNFYEVKGLRTDSKPFYVRMNLKTYELEYCEDGGVRMPWYTVTEEFKMVGEWCWMQIQQLEDL